MVRLERDRSLLVRQWLREANSSVFVKSHHRDALLQCRDGTLAWSGLVLASEAVPVLAQGLRGRHGCCPCSSSSSEAKTIIFHEFG